MIICSSLTTVVDWITYGQSPYNLKMGFGVLGNVTPDVSNYVQSGQVVGLLGGLVGAAQYEQLLLDNGIAALRRFSSADLVRSQLPTLCERLLDETSGPVSRHVSFSLTPDVRQSMRETAEKRFDKLTQSDKRAISVALNEVIGRDDVIPVAELASMTFKPKAGALFTDAELLRVKRRAYVENLFSRELAKADDPGRAMRWMTPQSFAHLALILAIILGNVSYFMERARSRREQRGGA
jgi:hypothetical protein